MANRANEDQFNQLHGLVTRELISRIKSGEATTQDIKAACDWLHKNNITGVATSGSPLAALLQALPDVDEEVVDRVVA
jgi:hypothetical protein